jgi:hypothetical protein
MSDLVGVIRVDVDLDRSSDFAAADLGGSSVRALARKNGPQRCS